MNSEECMVAVNQSIEISGRLNMLVGALSIEIQSNQRSFAINQVEINDHKCKANLFLTSHKRKKIVK
jgi:hypothetical protein